MPFMSVKSVLRAVDGDRSDVDGRAETASLFLPERGRLIEVALKAANANERRGPARPRVKRFVRVS